MEEGHLNYFSLVEMESGPNLLSFFCDVNMACCSTNVHATCGKLSLSSCFPVNLSQRESHHQQRLASGSRTPNIIHVCLKSS